MDPFVYTDPPKGSEPMTKKGGRLIPVLITAVVTAVLSIAGTVGVLRWQQIWPLAPSSAQSLNPMDIGETKLDTIYRYIRKYFLYEVTDQQMVDGLAAGLVASLEDRYAVYYPESEYSKFQEHNSGTYYGVGMQVSVDPDDNTILIVRVFANSPASKCGLQVGDKIIAINDEPYTGTDLDAAVSVMKGPKGVSVHITVLRGSEAVEFDAIRDEVIIETMDHNMLEDGIGYISAQSFDAHTAQFFRDSVKDLKNQGMKALVLDLRGNPGGLLDAVVDVAKQMYPKGVIVTTRDSNHEIIEQQSAPGVDFGIPVVLLIDNYSASASEILAVGLKEYKVATLIGEKTYGKGVVQSIIDLGDGTGFKLTTAQYFSPQDNVIENIGVSPDIELALPEDAYDVRGNILREKDNQLDKAIEVLKEQMAQ